MRKLVGYQLGEIPDPKTDILTKYMTENFTDRIRRIDEPIDIVDARLTPAARSAIQSLVDRGVEVRDSGNKYRDEMLAHNAEMAKLKSVDTVPLPPIVLKEAVDLGTYIQNLDTSLVYTTEVGSPKMNYPLSVLLQIFAPDIKIEYGPGIDHLYRTVEKHLYATNREELLATTDEYNLLWELTPYKFTTSVKNPDEKFYIYVVGDTCWNDLFSTKLVLPAYFGEINIARDRSLRKLWKPVMDFCLEVLYQQSKSLYSFIEEAQNGLR